VLKVAIVGGSGGIGRALIRELKQRDPATTIVATYRSLPTDALTNSDAGSGAETDATVQWSRLDVTDETAVAHWMQSLGSVDWLINCVGVLHTNQHQPEKSIRQFNPDWFMQSMHVNCMPTLLLAKYAHALLKSSNDPVFATVSARVGSIADNRLGGSKFCQSVIASSRYDRHRAI